MCHFGVMREITLTKSPNMPEDTMEGHRGPITAAGASADSAAASASLRGPPLPAPNRKMITAAGASAAGAAASAPWRGPPSPAPNRKMITATGASAASATASASLRGPPSPAPQHGTAVSSSNSVQSPMGHDTVFIPCMLNSVWGRDFDKWWEPWYVAPPPGQRVMAVRLEVGIHHYSSISLMPEILKGVLPHLDLTSEPILGSDGLMMHAKKSQLDSENHGSMATMMLMRTCEDHVFRVDIGVRKPWFSHKPPDVPFADVSVDQLYSLVSAQGLPRLAETLRANHATGKTLSGMTPGHIRTFFHATDGEVRCLMPAIQQWEARGVPQQPIDSAAPASPMHSMSKQLWIFIRAVADALPQEMSSSSRWLVLSPPMIATQGLPMEDRSDVGWSFADVIEARDSKTNLRCARTQHCVNYMECFAANDRNHRGFVVGAQVGASRFSEQKNPDVPSPPASSLNLKYSEQKHPGVTSHQGSMFNSTQKDPDVTSPPGSMLKSEQKHPDFTSPAAPIFTSPAVSPLALTSTAASASATTTSASNARVGSTSDAPIASDPASVPAAVSPIASTSASPATSRSTSPPSSALVSAAASTSSTCHVIVLTNNVRHVGVKNFCKLGNYN